MTEKEERNRGTTKYPENSKMSLSTYLSIIIFNVDGLNTPIKR